MTILIYFIMICVGLVVLQVFLDTVSNVCEAFWEKIEKLLQPKVRKK